MTPRCCAALLLHCLGSLSVAAQGVGSNFCGRPSLGSSDWYVVPLGTSLPSDATNFPVRTQLHLICAAHSGQKERIECTEGGRWSPDPIQLCAQDLTPDPTTDAYETLDYGAENDDEESAMFVPSPVDAPCGLDGVPKHRYEFIVRNSAGTIIPSNGHVTLVCLFHREESTIAVCESGRWIRMDDLDCPDRKGPTSHLALDPEVGCVPPVYANNEGLTHRLERNGCRHGQRSCMLTPTRNLIRPGTRLFFACPSDGLELSGRGSFYCKRSGEWSDDAEWPQCLGRHERRTCGSPSGIAHGWEVGAGGDGGVKRFRPGDSLSFYCAGDFARRGPAHLSCLPTGRWDNPVPVCVPTGRHGYREWMGLAMVCTLLGLLFLVVAFSLLHRRIVKNRLSSGRRSTILAQVEANRSRVDEMLAQRRESDRLALLALADGAGLPSYDDALSTSTTSAPASPREESARPMPSSTGASRSLPSRLASLLPARLRRPPATPEAPAAVAMDSPLRRADLVPASLEAFPPPPPPYEPSPNPFAAARPSPFETDSLRVDA